jgi:hypothetical protein
LNDEIPGDIQIHYHNIADGNTSLKKMLDNMEDVLKENDKLPESERIVVWNLSISGDKEIAMDYGISFLARDIDDLSNKYNILFIIASGNIKKADDKYLLEGTDSINSLTVSSVSDEMKKVEYSRMGSSTYINIKPDVSYYGREDKQNKRIKIFTTAKGFIED